MPRIAVTTSSADDQDFCHARDLFGVLTSRARPPS
jgi:hypothetical protein